MKIRLISLILAGALLPTGCNVFDPFDSPSGEEQYLSAARACFDNGDIECAREYYGKVSSTNDNAQAELAFAILDSAGMTMGTFIDAFSGGEFGGINAIAGKLSSKAGPELRADLYDAYKQAYKIRNVELRGLVRFISAIALTGGILAEGTGADGTLEKADIVNNTATCQAATSVSCAVTPDCAQPASSGSLPFAAIATLDPEDAASLPSLDGATADLGWAIGSLLAVQKAFTEMGVTQGSFSTGLGADIGVIAGTGAVEQCLRYQLINLGIGN